MLSRRDFATSTLAALFASSRIRAQEPEANYDEARVPTYTLPPILVRADGSAVRTKAAWRSRRAELLDLFAGTCTGAHRQACRGDDPEVDAPVAVLDGRAWRQQWRLEWERRASVDVLVYRPRHDRKVPVFIGLNYFGNHAVDPDPAIRLSTR